MLFGTHHPTKLPTRLTTTVHKAAKTRRHERPPYRQIAMLTSTAAAAAPDSLEFQAVWDNNNHGKALRPTNKKATQIILIMGQKI